MRLYVANLKGSMIGTKEQVTLLRLVDKGENVAIEIKLLNIIDRSDTWVFRH